MSELEGNTFEAKQTKLRVEGEKGIGKGQLTENACRAAAQQQQRRG
jgi:hypothetical protein